LGVSKHARGGGGGGNFNSHEYQENFHTCDKGNQEQGIFFFLQRKIPIYKKGLKEPRRRKTLKERN